MTDFQKEIDELQKRMAELERQKLEHEIDEQQKKSSMKHNFSIFEKQFLTRDDVFNQYRPKAENDGKAQRLIQQEERRLQTILQQESLNKRGQRQRQLSKIGKEAEYEIHCLSGGGPIWNEITAETVYNMLKIIDNRLTKLENNI